MALEKGERLVFPYLAILVASAAVIRSERLDDQLTQVLKELIARDAWVEIGPKEFNAIKKVEKLDPIFYSRICVKQLLKIEFDQALQYARLGLWSAGSAA